jgi:hypothetical protein
MRTALLLLLAAIVLQAAVDGTVVNGSTGRSQAGVSVTLVAVSGAGMQPQASVTSDPAGQFRFSQTPQGPTLLQATHQGVTYNLMVQPGAPSTGLKLEVFDASTRPGAAKVIEDVVLLEPLGAELSVRENVIWQNGGRETYHDPAGGTLRFYAPPEAKDTLRVSATAPNGLPLEHAAVPAGPRNVFKVDFPIKPGDTTFEVSYRLPFTSPGSFSGRGLQKDAPLRLAVPDGVAVKGEGLELLGQEPRSKASVYGVKTADYQVEITGTGSMAAAPAGGSEGSGSGFDQILPRVYGSAYAILGLALVILALGFILLYRKKAPASTSAQDPASPRSRNRR